VTTTSVGPAPAPGEGRSRERGKKRLCSEREGGRRASRWRSRNDGELGCWGSGGGKENTGPLPWIKGRGRNKKKKKGEAFCFPPPREKKKNREEMARRDPRGLTEISRGQETSRPVPAPEERERGGCKARRLSFSGRATARPWPKEILLPGMGKKSGRSVHGPRREPRPSPTIQGEKKECSVFSGGKGRTVGFALRGKLLARRRSREEGRDGLNGGPQKKEPAQDPGRSRRKEEKKRGGGDGGRTGGERVIPVEFAKLSWGFFREKKKKRCDLSWGRRASGWRGRTSRPSSVRNEAGSRFALAKKKKGKFRRADGPGRKWRT